MKYDVKVHARKIANPRETVERYYIVEVNYPDEVDKRAIALARQDGAIVIKVLRRTCMARGDPIAMPSFGFGSRFCPDSCSLATCIELTWYLGSVVRSVWF
ncbi:hypothetical protein D3227_26605 [Mesorhizobium waimense]|uniref:Uncharacterized protein n=1 Tax=Mesorhizobium waimense TaxID=1300307 RepID=A0A3A5KE49_9HYPH|nr:hypothetical protein [Mesorhizobium waimense]RJT32592.1 hypothetical protein D3227_26605 [Mesorhizobium waimense]